MPGLPWSNRIRGRSAVARDPECHIPPGADRGLRKRQAGKRHQPAYAQHRGAIDRRRETRIGGIVRCGCGGIDVQVRSEIRARSGRFLRSVAPQDEERRRLALELHDSAGQLLVALKWKLGSLRKEIGPDHAEWAKLAADAFRFADELSQELRTVSHLLHPPLLDQAGLTAALRSYPEGLAERSGLTVDLEMDPDLHRMPRETEAIIFRVVQGITDQYPSAC